MKFVSYLTILLSIQKVTFCQTAIDVYESTLKISARSEETYMCGLAEGDQLIFSFQEINGKELKELEILEYPSSSKFMDYRIKLISNKILNISKTGIYKFRFANTALTGRVCRFKIQRVPISDNTKSFNTSVYYRTESDTVITNLTDQVTKVHSTMNSNGNKSSLNFTLPANTIAWSYYIGVDQAGKESFDKASQELAQNATPLVNAIPGYGPLAALALGSTSFLSLIQGGEDVDFVITDNNNASLFLSNQPYRFYKRGKVLNDFSRMTDPKSGMLFICFINDNAVTGISVIVKVTAISVSTVQIPYLHEE